MGQKWIERCNKKVIERDAIRKAPLEREREKEKKRERERDRKRQREREKE